MNNKFSGKVAVITGASSGIGKAVAESLVKEGATVALCARRKELLFKIANSLKDCDGIAVPMQLDVSDEEAVSCAIEKITGEFKKIDILVNSASCYVAKSIIESSAADLKAHFNTDVLGTFVCTREVLKTMSKQLSGSIINVTSIAAIRAQAGLSIYSSMKAAITHFTSVAALEAAKFNIRVNAVLPGIIDTPFLGEVDGALRKDIDKSMRYIPLARMGSSKEVTEAVAFLASDNSSYITGATLVVDGGLVAKINSPIDVAPAI